MRIANPIYDVVFRYLMEDNKVARLLLSAILEKEIVELKFNPTEQTIIREQGVMVFRMDFSAKVKDEKGNEEVILIELQRAKYYFQMMRFRRYLGKQYQSQHNLIDVRETRGGNIVKKGIPIFPIYILGQAFTKNKIPVIRVSRNYIDAATKKKIDERHDFIESLTHDAIVIQIPYLKERRRTELEQFLEIFDQSNIADTAGHFLEINEDDYPQKYKAVIRRLIKAIASPRVIDNMDLEDEVVEYFNSMDVTLEKSQKATKEAQQKAEQERQKAEQERQKAEQERQKAEQERKSKNTLIQKMATLNVPLEEIAEMTQLTIEEVKFIIKKQY